MTRIALLTFLAAALLPSSIAWADDTPEEQAVFAVAKRHGINRVVFDQSVVHVLNRVIERAVPAEKMKAVAFSIGWRDEYLKAVQIWDKGETLFFDEESQLRVLVTGYKGAIYPGTPITSLKVEYWKMVGTKTYEDVSHASSTVLVIRPAWLEPIPPAKAASP